MRILRNPEVYWIFWPNLLIAAASAFLLYRFALRGMEAWKLALLAGAAFCLTGIVFLIVSAVHSRKVVRFTQRIDKNLHGHQDLRFEDFREGDFAMLQSTVSKMVNAHFQQESLLQAEKKHLADELADISHQIKTPLAAISLNAEQLASADMEPMRRRMTARRTFDLIERIRVLVRTLLNESRLDAGIADFKKETFTVQSLVDESVQSLLMTMDLHDQTLEMDIPPDITIDADKFWLTEALTNVVKNCTEHTPDGGTVTITATSNAVFTCITVHDTGPGIDPEVLPHIFERFVKGRDPGRNTNSIGIGLAYAKQVIHKMDGVIEASNDPEGGAVFTIHLFKVNV